MTDAARDKWREVRAMDVPVRLELGPNLADRYINDPKRVGFYMARYAATAKLLRGCHSILDIGSGDSFASITFLNDTVASDILCIDFDEALVAHANQNLRPALDLARPNDSQRIRFERRDFLTDDYFLPVEGVCCLDVIEHLQPSDSDAFFSRATDVILDGGIAVFGTPNRLASQYASAHSEVGHTNLYDATMLRDQLERHFNRVIILSMNDSVVHFGFEGMAHYLLAACLK